jgi:hypothetical protein
MNSDYVAWKGTLLRMMNSEKRDVFFGLFFLSYKPVVKCLQQSEGSGLHRPDRQAHDHGFVV